MTRHALLAASFGVVVAVGYGLSHFERYEDSFILAVDSAAYDPVGKVKDLYNRATRDCSTVSPISPQSEDWAAITYALSHMEEPMPAHATLLKVMRSGDWFMVESNFAQLEPAIFLLKRSGSSFKVQPQGVWSGTPAPWTPGPVIRAYLGSKVPDAPYALVRCFDPTLEHFKS